MDDLRSLQVPAEPVQPTRVAEERPKRFTFTLGPVYGHNFKEQDEGETENDLIGAEFTFNALTGFLGGLSLKQMVCSQRTNSA